MEEANPLLVRHFNRLPLAKGTRVFLPLCGKTLHIAWLLGNGYRVVSAELSEKAITGLFAGLGIVPDVSQLERLTHFSHADIDIFVGDIFSLSRNVLGPVDAIYDRAALVALPSVMRQWYSAHLRQITDSARQLLICYEYDQQLMDGPPFSVSSDEVKAHYENYYGLTQLEWIDVAGGLKDQRPAVERVWLLQER